MKKEREKEKEIKPIVPCPQEIHCPLGKTKTNRQAQ